MTSNELLVSTVVNAWKLVVSRIDQAVASCGDSDFQREVAPGKNRIFYLLGHLTAVHDRLFPLLRVGARLHPDFDEIFLANPDRTSPDTVSPADLKKAWSEVNGKLTAAFENLRPEEWLERHNDVSPEDFAKEPLRNRLAVLLSRTSHASFHGGQLALVKK
jgi:hypothetical protein